jgi:uncharacterized low-complexity protein
MKTRNAHLKLATGAAIAATVAFAPVALAADNPFSMQTLGAGYQLAQADKKVDGKCGEGKCGATKKVEEKKKDGSCGAGKAKDGSCGAAKADTKKKDGSCGGAKAKDGSCGAKK